MSKSAKRSIALICVICLIAGVIGGFSIAGAVEGKTAYSEIPLYVDGIRAGNGLKTGDTTYIPLRAFCEALEIGAEVSWNENEQTANVIIDGLTIVVSADGRYMSANGRYLYLADGTKNVDGTMLVPVKELAKAFGVGVSWDNEHWSMNVDTADISFIQSGDEYYDQEDLYWLSHIISAESGNQPLEGMIGVGNVILNRVEDESCPDTIYDVIFDTTHGVQFTPVTTGSIYDEPVADAVTAAKICLEGYETVGASLFFLNPTIGSSEWFYSNREYVTTIGDHDFYA